MKLFFITIIRLYYIIFFGIKIHNFDKVPKEGSYLICSNHKNFQDPLVIGVSMKRYITAMAKKELFQTKLTNWFFRINGAFPVDRNANDITAVKTAIKTLKSGLPVLIFPEGTRNFTKTPLEVKPGVAMIAIRAKVPVLPVTITSDYKLFRPIHLTFGDPINLDEYYGRKVTIEEYQKVSQDIVNTIYERMV